MTGVEGRLLFCDLNLNPSLAKMTCLVPANSVDPDQLASEDAK